MTRGTQRVRLCCLVDGRGMKNEDAMTKFMLLAVGATVVALATPASAQPATTNQSWEGAVHEMQIRGPRSTMRGPLPDGRIVVTPGYQRTVKRHHRPKYYGMAR